MAPKKSQKPINENINPEVFTTPTTKKVDSNDIKPNKVSAMSGWFTKPIDVPEPSIIKEIVVLNELSVVDITPENSTIPDVVILPPRELESGEIIIDEEFDLSLSSSTANVLTDELTVGSGFTGEQWLSSLGKKLSTGGYTDEQFQLLLSIFENYIIKGGLYGPMTQDDREKLDSIAYDANNYIHPDFHPASMIIEDENRVFLSSSQKAQLLSLTGSATYTHSQILASKTWVINHNLGRFPSVSIVDSGGNLVVGEISYPNSNRVVLTFTSEFSGKAYIN